MIDALTKLRVTTAWFLNSGVRIDRRAIILSGRIGAVATLTQMAAVLVLPLAGGGGKVGIHSVVIHSSVSPVSQRVVAISRVASLHAPMREGVAVVVEVLLGIRDAGVAAVVRRCRRHLHLPK